MPNAEAQFNSVCPTSSIKLTSNPPSMASIRASVSLLRMQSMSWRCERSPALSVRLSPGRRLVILHTPVFGSAFLPSNNSTSSRSTRRIVSRQHLVQNKAQWVESRYLFNNTVHLTYYVIHVNITILNTNNCEGSTPDWSK